MEVNFLQTKLSDLTVDSGLRFDYKFYDFVLESEFKLIPKCGKVIQLKDILFSTYKRFDYQEGKEYKGLPTAAEYYNENGDVINAQTVTKDEHPDRICYKIEKGNILISSLKDAKAPVLHITFDETNQYVVSNGFYIFKIKNPRWNEKYIWYLLRTNLIRDILDNHLSSGIGISSYKENDLLRIKIPTISLEKQLETLNKIKPLQEEINAAYTKIESLQNIIDDVFEKNGCPTIPRLKRDEKYFFNDRFNNISKTNWLSIRTYLCRFVENELPLFLKENLKSRYIPLNKYVKKIRSGEYIPKQFYSSSDTNFVYLRVNNISSNELDLEEPIFLRDDIGKKYKNIVLSKNDLVLTRSGTVGKCIIFKTTADDDRIFIPSHHLAVIQFNNFEDAAFLKYYLQSSFGSDFFWAFSTGKSQKEITNWSIRKLPIPILEKAVREKIISEIQQREEKSNQYKEEIKKLRNEIDALIYKSLGK